jgi:hypothetical protein
MINRFQTVLSRLCNLRRHYIAGEHMRVCLAAAAATAASAAAAAGVTGGGTVAEVMRCSLTPG